MRYVQYISLALASFFLIKILIALVDEKYLDLQNKIHCRRMENGFLSIMDLQKKDYKRFIDTIYTYLTYHKYEDITTLPKASSEQTNITGFLNNEKIYISCIQNHLLDEASVNDDNWSHTETAHIQCFISRVLSNKCRKGVLIINSTFSKNALSFVEEFNSSNMDLEIHLVNGYELTRSIRNYNNYLNRMESVYED